MSRPNLTPLTLVSVLWCVLGGRSGLTRRATLATQFIGAGHVADGREFAFAFDVEEKDLVLKGHAQLGIGLADAGKDDLAARAARLEGAIEFAAAGDVAAAAMLDHESGNVQVGVGLDAVADQAAVAAGSASRTPSAIAADDAAAWPCCRRTGACRISRQDRLRGCPHSATGDCDR